MIITLQIIDHCGTHTTSIELSAGEIPADGDTLTDLHLRPLAHYLMFEMKKTEAE